MNMHEISGAGGQGHWETSRQNKQTSKQENKKMKEQRTTHAVDQVTTIK